MPEQEPARTRWQGHPIRAFFLRVLAFVTPIGAAIGVGAVAKQILPPPKTTVLLIGWWALLCALATATLLGVDRFARRLLPVAALLKLSLLFPDKAPSRFKVALRAGNARQLERRIEQAREQGASDNWVWDAETVLELTAALSAHDRRSRGHSERVRAFADLLGEEMRLEPGQRDLLHWAALLHDIGKVTVPPEILNKPGKPTQEEWEALKRHPLEGEKLVTPLAEWLGEWTRAVGEHHERWDGNGYPRGLKQTEISLAARIVAVADSFEVMTAARSYKKPVPAEAARRELGRCAGSQFDPSVVRAFLSVTLGRLRLAMGPFSWLAQVPVAGRVPLVPAFGTVASALLAAGTMLLGGLVDGSPRSSTSPIEGTAATKSQQRGYTSPTPPGPVPPNESNQDGQGQPSPAVTGDPPVTPPLLPGLPIPSGSTGKGAVRSRPESPSTGQVPVPSPPAAVVLAPTPPRAELPPTSPPLPPPSPPPPPPPAVTSPTITSGPGARGNASSPTWAFTEADGARSTCRLMRDSSVVSALGPCSSPATYDLSGQPDGTYTFSVRQSDGAGNSSTFAVSEYLLDRSAPPPPAITSKPAAVSSDAAPVWAFSGESGSSFDCQLMRGATVVVARGPCSSPKTYEIDGEPDATYSFAVRATDAAGNTSPATTNSYVLDRSVPPNPLISSAPGSPGSSLTPTWAFSGEAGASFECQLSRGGTALLGLGPCSSTRTYDLVGQPEALYSFAVRQLDEAGNASSFSTADYQLDLSAPTAPTITSGPGPTGADVSPSWTFSGETAASFECQISQGGTVISPLSVCTSPATFNLSARPDAMYTFAVRQLDQAGNLSSLSTAAYDLDRSAPAAPTITSGPGPTGADVNPTWTFNGEPGVTFECQLSRGGAMVAAGPCTSAHDYDLTADPDGTYTFSVRAIDASGNLSSFATADYELDRSPPAPPTLSAGPGADGSDPTPEWAFTGEAAASYQCQLMRGATVISALGPCTSPAAFDLSAQADATYTFSVRQSDGAGNLSSFTTADYSLVRPPPPPPTITSGPAAIAADGSPAWAFTGEAGASFQCELTTGATVISSLAACSSPQGYDLSSQPDATYTFSVRQLNGAGTPSPFSTAEYKVDRSSPASPTITSGPGATGSDSTPTWAFAGESGATFECQLKRGATVTSTLASCTSPATFDLTAEPDATYTLSVRQVDNAGNTSAFTTTDYTLNRSTPPAPTITSGPGAAGFDSTPTWAFTGEPGATFECRLMRGTTVISAVAPCASPATFNLTTEPDGTYTFSVRQIGGSGIPSSFASVDYAFTQF